jgi:AcrR family transcriptional regulator
VGLSRHQILETALKYIDAHGPEALSMHKLGAELGVKGMSLYNHVANKGDVLDGVVEVLWSQVETAAPAEGDACEALRSLARAIRMVMLRHSNAAPLIISRQVMPEPALRIVQSHQHALAADATTGVDAYAILRTITSYAMGTALAQIGWGSGGIGCAPAVSDLLRPGTPDELAAVAEVFCGQSDYDAQFELGLDLMLRGLSA